MEIKKLISFIEESEKLKSVVRTAWTSEGRRESTAEHSWRLALFAGVLSDSFPELDLSKILMMSLIHDIGEIYEGDISAASCPDKRAKYAAEYQAAQSVFAILPEPQASRLMDIWMEYNDNSTPEAKLVKALDKAETIIQHNQGNNPPDFDYQFNLEYGKEYFQSDDRLKPLRSMIDEKTRQRMAIGRPGF
ncbi:HD domain-containing protein [Caproicibacter sp. BJN0012]|uniref:HD domain-containing protein n=1 Tax=Caproicibacter sp. BJN0012 TaxID=3110227 RepID=UPI002E14E683